MQRQIVYGVGMAERPDSPGVWFPPPIWYLLAVLGGWLLNRQWPLPLDRSYATIIVALLFLMAGIALALGAGGRFRRAGTTRVPIRPATALVTTGPFAHTRNPMYVSLALVTLGLGVLLATWWPIILLAPTLLIVQTFVIQPEERYLRRRFGADYEAYTRRVRRWL